MYLAPSQRPSREAGFTLVELTLGAALMALILASSYACLHSGLRARRVLEPRWEALQSARVALALLSADLRAAFPLSKESEFVGIDRKIGDVEADNVDFGTLNYSPRRPGEGDFCQTSYFLEPDRRSGEFVLWRRRNPRIGPDPLRGGTREEIARGVRQLKLEYYDGFEWYDTWGDAEGNGKRETSALAAWNLSGIPEAVRITMAFDTDTRAAGTAASEEGGTGVPGAAGDEASREPPLVFQTVVRIEAGGSSSGTGTGGSGASTTANPAAGGSAGAPATGGTPTRGR
ncbi:MAG: hypothetical protein JNL97_15995 [Verrucomicrobiales bacterium]|nr:hypothetical protein [Verrucomicrobiales bacterium]